MQGPLLAWYDANKRPLPWRKNRDPYSVLVSEAMCQQTRIDTVLPYYAAWMKRWPTVEALAKAPEEEVMAAWAGLGYYRRARNLHAAAKSVTNQGWPEDLQNLPGVGAYTAAALGSIAFDKPHACVDGNVERVLARLHDANWNPRDAAGKRRLQNLADAALDPSRPGDWNQAMMELGATICKPTPSCDECPISVSCLAFEQGTVHERPVLPARRKPRVDEVDFGYLERDGKVLLVERPPGLLGGTWMLPGGQGALPALVKAQTGWEINLGAARRVEHVFTHRIWKMRVHKLEGFREVGPGDLPTRWVSLDALDDLGVSAAARKAISLHRK